MEANKRLLWVVILWLIWGASGCLLPPQGPLLPEPPPSTQITEYPNPLLLPTTDYEKVWEILADVIDDEFRIQREMPVRQVGDAWTEGRLETYPLVGSTLLEPWHQDAPNFEEKLLSTFQTIRRRAVVRVMPAQAGQWVEVVVFKELEDARPVRSPAASAVFRYDTSLTRIELPVSEQPTNRGWIPLGRDTALEQYLLGKIQARVAGVAPQPIPFCPWRTVSGN